MKKNKVRLAVPVSAAEKQKMAEIARRKGKSLSDWAAGEIRAAREQPTYSPPRPHLLRARPSACMAVAARQASSSASSSAFLRSASGNILNACWPR